MGPDGSTTGGPRGVAADFAWQPAHVLADLVRAGTVSAGEVVETFLARVDRLDGDVHAFITIAMEQARATARDIHCPPARGNGDLCGVPFSVKDNVLTAGVRTTLGSLLFRAYTPSAGAPAVDRLTACGAILLGKANVPEFSAYGRTVNRLGPECRNPWDLARTAGGSSGGSAAAVAAGLVPLSIGTDDGGSVRLPAALNGVFGFVPTPGIVSMDGVVVPAAVSGIGPLARDVRDAAIAVDLMDGAGGRGLAATLDLGVAGLQVAWMGSHATLPVTDPRVVETSRRAAHALAEAGAHVDDLDVPLVPSTGCALVPDDGSGRHGGMHIHELEEFAAVTAAPDWATQLAPYTNMDALQRGFGQPSDASEAEDRRRAVIGQLLELFDTYDLVCTPTIDQIAPEPHDEWGYPYGPLDVSTADARAAYTKYTLRANLAGCPAASVPSGFVDGMPTGLHIIGRPGADALVLRASRALELRRSWSPHRPAMAQ